MYLVYDTTTNNILAEYEEFHEAEQRRIQVIGANPLLAEAIEVIDLDRTVDAYERERSGAVGSTARS